MLAALNIAFFVVHSLLIVFNLVGWIWPGTRRLHLLTLGGTLFSWLVIGAWKGWGYCVCADWHFRIRRQMGIHDHESSYTELLANQIPGVTVTRPLADLVTVGGLLVIVMATALVWLRPASSPRITPAPGTHISRRLTTAPHNLTPPETTDSVRTNRTSEP